MLGLAEDKSCQLNITECHCHRTFAYRSSTEEHLFIAFHGTAMCYCQALFQVSWLLCAAWCLLCLDRSVTSLQSQLIHFPTPWQPHLSCSLQDTGCSSPAETLSMGLQSAQVFRQHSSELFYRGCMQHHSMLSVLACSSWYLAHNMHCCLCICSAGSKGTSTGSPSESSHCNNLLHQQKLAHVLHESIQGNSTSCLGRHAWMLLQDKQTSMMSISQPPGMRLANTTSDAQQLQLRFAEQSDGMSPASRRPQTPRLCSATTRVLMTSKGCRCRFAE